MILNVVMCCYSFICLWFVGEIEMYMIEKFKDIRILVIYVDKLYVILIF